MIKNRSWVYIAILTLVVAVTWATISAVSYFRKTTVPTDVEKAASPLDPNIDMSFFAKLQERTRQSQ